MWQHLLTAGAGLLCLAGPVSARSRADEATPLNPCPILCSLAGQSPLNWTYLHGAEALNRCKEPMLLSMVLDNRLDDPSKHTTIRACTASEEVQEAEEISNASPFAFGKPEKRALDEAELAATCATDMHKSANETTLYYHEWLTDAGSNVSGNISDTTTTLSKLQEYISTVADDCKPSFVLAKTRNAIAGLFTGSSVGKQSAAPLVGYLANYIKDKENYEAGRVAIQNCYGKRPSAWGIGVVADLQGNITAVQESLANWRDAKCIESPDTNMPWMETVLDIWSLKASTSTNGTLPESNSTLARRADECRALQVGSGDTCTTMAQRCGISLTRFQNFNTAKNFCDPLMDKVWACCTVGDVPDFRPKPDADGTCYSYDIGDGDGCWDVADAHYLKVADIESLNKQTWGWGGCGNLQAGQKICLSKGNPPMPNTISNAICGPQKPNGESRGNKKLADMNPCPLNVCCNFWGQCGMDRDFCVEAPADTGAPGTSKPGANGCIANCGMQITNNKEGPASFSHIAYFEAWNKERDCLHMDVTDIDTKKYTHIHFSFPDVTPGDFKVDVSRWQKQFDMMKKMTGIKRIVSLGGWANSAELPNYYIMRQAVMAQNRGVFVANIVSFVNEHGLDGIDIDWEYPGAENLGEGVPPGEADEGANYLETLKMLKRRMGSKSVSIAAPASYWYLRGFPIKDIGAVVDYIVYMTYDLHGQWDHGNKWATTGCPSGDCLRSHVNLTETQTSLAMITKAGVPSKKVFVGIASYGRSFKMAKAGCTGVDCKYTGTRLLSNARPGMCTDTGGYIASAEIREILWNKEVLGAREWHDKESDSDIVVYQDTEWLAWMNDKTKQDRILYYQSINFGGVSDWAVDLDKDYGDSGIGSGDPDDSSLSGGRTCPLSKTYKDLDSLAVDDSVADDCKPVLALGVLETMLDESMAMYEDTNNGYDENFEAYRRIMKDSVKEAALRFFHWRTGGYANYFDCDVKDLEDSRKNWNGPCSNIDEGARDFLKSRLTITVKMRDESGFYNALEEETGAAADWVQFGMHKEPDYDHNNPCPGTPVIGGEITCKPPTYGLVVNGIPVLKDDFEIANPKDIIKEISGNLEEVRDGMAARFFDIVAGIWDGGNGDVLQVYSVPIFLLSQAVGSMQTANEMGAEIREQQKKDFITLIISALLFFIPFVGQFAAMAAGAATVARMIAIAGMAGNAAFSIVDIIDNPENAAMAVVGLLTAGRVRKPRDFVDLGSARRAQTKAGVAKMGDDFKKHDNSLQNVLGNCRQEGSKNDDDGPKQCNNKRDLDVGYHDDPLIFKRASDSFSGLAKRQNGKLRPCLTEMDITSTTSIGTTLTTPAKTCSAKWKQACYHYSSAMSVHAATPDMVRWTCWATENSSRIGRATNDWGLFKTRDDGHSGQHHGDWGWEWAQQAACDRDEWPPRNFWTALRTDLSGPSPRTIAAPGQVVRLLPATQNRGAGSLWRQFCEKNDGYQVKANGVTKINEKFVKTTSAEVSKEIKTGTTTYHTSVGVEIPNAVFEIKHWEQAPARDDGLWDNPCWASQLMPNDPGYALLINDPWYKKNPGATASTDLYSEPPLNPVTSGKTRSRMYAGNPRVAVRDNIWEDDGLVEDGGETTPFTSAAPAAPAVTGTFTQGDADAERRKFIDEDGTEFVEVVAEDVDCGELANALMASGEMPASTRPARRDAVASDVPGSEGEDLVHAAMPGSYVPDGRAKPTQGLS